MENMMITTTENKEQQPFTTFTKVIDGRTFAVRVFFPAENLKFPGTGRKEDSRRSLYKPARSRIVAKRKKSWKAKNPILWICAMGCAI